ncbi:MAG: nitroreductase family deazaflavin-dependent oxidoreductase [Chloroflexi bacterium]|nr:nitroreductase family deazaflavin-dependent oxidoreductase [Chloroflexota bacterium]MCL5273333.1 nitroreductase family deazaflavin-dependent oxidoreductase [Chloroflexota bacterium]
MSIFTKYFPHLNVFLYRISKGRLGARLRQQNVLLLHTVGRSSGRAYTTPLSYYRDAAIYIVVASNWGEKDQPHWFRNLLQQQRATIQVKDQTIQVRARQTQGKEYDRLWDLVTRQNPQFLQYQRGLQRRIPVITLTPQM